MSYQVSSDRGVSWHEPEPFWANPSWGELLLSCSTMEAQCQADPGEPLIMNGGRVDIKTQ